jgi:hypothetical protein
MLFLRVFRLSLLSSKHHISFTKVESPSAFDHFDVFDPLAGGALSAVGAPYYQHFLLNMITISTIPVGMIPLVYILNLNTPKHQTMFRFVQGLARNQYLRFYVYWLLAFTLFSYSLFPCFLALNAKLHLVQLGIYNSVLSKTLSFYVFSFVSGLTLLRAALYIVRPYVNSAFFSTYLSAPVVVLTLCGGLSASQLLPLVAFFSIMLVPQLRTSKPKMGVQHLRWTKGLKRLTDLKHLATLCLFIVFIANV